MSAEFIIAITTLLVALGLSAVAIKQMRSPKYESRENQLQKELDKLRNALEIMNTDRAKDRKEIESLQRQLDSANKRIVELEIKLARYESEKKTSQEQLLVIIGSDPKLNIDLATLRGVKRVTGMNFNRVLNAKFDDVHRILSEARLRGKPIRRVLFSVHSNASGIQLDRLVSPEELSAELQDVEVLMIAGCESAAMGQWLSVVPYVVTLREKVPMEDASRFVEAYFTDIGNGENPEDAFYNAIDKVPTVGEYSELHTK